jgi:hypothetical protein
VLAFQKRGIARPAWKKTFDAYCDRVEALRRPEVFADQGKIEESVLLISARFQPVQSAWVAVLSRTAAVMSSRAISTRSRWVRKLSTQMRIR